MSAQRGPFTTAPGPRRSLLCWEIWAEDGKIMMMDKENGEVVALSVQTATGRLRVFADELRILDLERTYAVNRSIKAKLNEQYKHRKMLVEYVGLTIEDALEQGNADDIEVQKTKIRQFYRSRGATDGKCSVDRLMEALFGGVDKR